MKEEDPEGLVQNPSLFLPQHLVSIENERFHISPPFSPFLVFPSIVFLANVLYKLQFLLKCVLHVGLAWKQPPLYFTFLLPLLPAISHLEYQGRLNASWVESSSDESALLPFLPLIIFIMYQNTNSQVIS